MPIYEYDCPRCGPFEMTQRITEPALQTHAQCGSPVRRLLSATSFALKGTGWYITDYARKGNQDGGKKSESAAKSEGGAKSESSAKTEASAAA